MKRIIICVIIIIVILAVVLGMIYIFNSNKTKNKETNLTLKTISNMVNSRKEKLTWKDFEQYRSIEIGSGLYILLYEIDENYKLLVGGILTEEPMYIRLVSQKNSEQYIDIRYENINEFLSKVK